MMKWLRFDTKLGTSAVAQKQERSFISQTQMKTRMWICAVNSIYLLCIMESRMKFCVYYSFHLPSNTEALITKKFIDSGNRFLWFHYAIYIQWRWLMKLVSENSVRFKASSIVQTDTIRMFQSCRTDYTGFRLSRRTTYKSIHFLMHQSHSRPIIKKDPFITTRHTDTVSVGRFVSGFSLVPRLPICTYWERDKSAYLHRHIQLLETAEHVSGEERYPWVHSQHTVALPSIACDGTDTPPSRPVF